MGSKMKRIACLIYTFCVFLLSPLLSQTWSPPQRLTWNSGDSNNPSIAVDSSDNLYCVYSDSTYGNYELVLKKSPDGGTTWFVNKRLTWNSGHSVHPCLFIGPDDVIHVAWHDNTPGNSEIFYKRSLNGGVNWSPTQRITYNTGSSNSAAMAIDSNKKIHLFWADNTPGSYEIYYKSSTNTGYSWSPLSRLTWNTGSSSDPNVDIDSRNNLFLIWADVSSGNWEILFKRSGDSGGHWSLPVRLTYTAGITDMPDLTVNSKDDLLIFWKDDTPGNFEIFHKKSTDSGNNWSSPNRMTWNTGISKLPNAVIDSNDNIHLVWGDYTYPYGEIMYKTYLDSACTWSPLQRLTYTPDISENAVIKAASDNTLFVFWSDKSPGNYEIFFKKR
jgi:hypothetical protein